MNEAAAPPPEPSASPQPGVLHALPIAIPESLTLDAASFAGAFTPWGVPSALGLVGRAATDDSARLLIGYEWPVLHGFGVAPVDKPWLERLHLNRYQTHELAAAGSLPYTEVDHGADPPDFRATCSGEAVGIDCTQLALQERRVAHALFRRLREAVVREPRDRFAHLVGLVVYVWFGVAPRTLPFRSSDRAAVVGLVDALAAYRPDRSRLVVEDVSQGLPDELPALDLQTTTAGATFHAVPLVGGMPGSPFFLGLGFELGFGYTTLHSPTSLRDELQRLISAHDTNKVDHLLISLGAPDRYGYAYPAEDLAASFFLEHWESLVRPRHIRRILLQFWSSGATVAV